MATTQDNKKLIEQFFQAFDRGDFDTCQKMCAGDIKAHFTSAPDMNLQSYRQFAEAWRKGFPDMRHTTDLQVAEGDLVVTYLTWDGKHTGEYLGIAPTNKPIHTQAVFINRIQDGKIAEAWGVLDGAQWLAQIGQKQLPQMPPVEKPSIGGGYVNPRR